MANILVTGGCGYIGSLTSLRLSQLGYNVIILDNLSRSNNYSFLDDFKVINCDICDKDKLKDIFRNQKVDIVIHFAALIDTAESFHNSFNYITTNIYGTLNLLKCMKSSDVKKIIYSSSASVYGIPGNIPIDEVAEKNPISPYGATKSVSEDLIMDFVKEHSFAGISLRYFNACGTSSDKLVFENHKPVETHLIPNIFKSIESNTRFNLYGTDYPTPDGTAIRDYVHIEDLVQAHIKAINVLTLGEFMVFNVGSGRGYSIKECIKTVEEATNKEVKIDYKPRRTGDPSCLVAKIDRIKKELSWQPSYNLLDIIKSL